MTTVTMKRLACGAAILGGLTFASVTPAQLAVGTWVRQGDAPRAGVMMLTIEMCCNGGRRLTYRIKGSDTTLTVESRLDGSDAPVLVGGKPSGETMAITRLDDHHTATAVKMNGKLFGTSKATLSPDGNTLTVENDYGSAAGGPMAGKKTEIWVRKPT